LKIFDVLVVSSIEEGLNTSVMDALALKVPVVATNIGGIPEVITHQQTGFLVPPSDHGALAEGILWMLNNRPQAETLAEEGCRMVRERFSATAMVQNNLEVYRRLIDKQE
jgi:glycosyltransferase involved in cell wall biosynthesis